MDTRDWWKVGIGVLIALGLALHAVYPRYDWRIVNPDGTAIVIYDRWGGAFQRASWNDKGEVVPTQPFKPY